MRNRIFSILFLLFVSITAFSSELRQVAILDMPGQPGFDGLAFASGHLLITHSATGTLDIVHLARRRLVAQVTGLANPKGIAVDEPGGRIYVANSDAKNIAVISTRDWKLLETIPSVTSPYLLTLAPGGGRLYVANWRDQSVSAVEVRDGNKARTVDVGGTPQDLVFDPERGVLFTTLQDRAEVIALSADDLRVVGRYKLLASQPTGMVLDSSKHMLYIAVRYAVLAVDSNDGHEVSRAAAPAGVDTLWLDAPSGTLYAASAGGTISIFRTVGAKLTSMGEINTEVRGHTLAFDPVTKLLYMPGGREGRSKLLILKRVGAELPEPTTAK